MTSLRARLLASLLSLLAVAVALVGLLTYRTVLAENDALFDYQLRQMALSLRDQGAIAPAERAALADERLDYVVQIWAADGRVVYVSRELGALWPRAVLGYANVALDGSIWRVFSTASGDRVIQVGQPLAIRRELAARAAFNAALPLLLGALPLALGVWWLVGAVLAPLGRVAGAVKQVQADALAPLPAAGLPSEVAPLVEALNAMLARLGRAFEVQRAFVADAAHELRSPLTALKLQLELLRRAPDEAERATATAALAAGIERARHLVEQLLALARSEPGAGAAFAQLDLAEVARQALADTLPLAHARKVQLGLEAERPVPLQGDAAALRVLARNLADNAVRYTPAGGQVELRVAVSDGAPTLTVDDSGPGIAPAERERVFDRFYRGVTAGASDIGSGSGSGIGLAIVRAVAQRHGAQVQLADSPLGGLQVQVHFAAPPARESA
jgi:two-component system OmpR family sensor kinase/two-component system sensor histidine kinase QseC